MQKINSKKEPFGCKFIYTEYQKKNRFQHNRSSA